MSKRYECAFCMDRGFLLAPCADCGKSRAYVAANDRDTPAYTCTCGHHYEDHQPPTESEWMRGGIAVREEHEECGICGCTDFEEDDTNG